MTRTGVATLVLNEPAQTPARELSAADQALALFEAHGHALYRFARVSVHGASDAEDIVQTTFARLLDHLGRGGSRSNLKAWLFAVAANLCRDHLRRRRRWLNWQREHDALMRTEPELETRDPHELFLATLRMLAPRDRLLLGLKAQGLSYREIAAASGIREASVGRLLARAMTRWHRARAAISPS
jgi:RNA polymerase sigma-70 factor, ECF subfamily